MCSSSPLQRRRRLARACDVCSLPDKGGRPLIISASDERYHQTDKERDQPPKYHITQAGIGLRGGRGCPRAARAHVVAVGLDHKHRIDEIIVAIYIAVAVPIGHIVGDAVKVEHDVYLLPRRAAV